MIRQFVNAIKIFFFHRLHFLKEAELKLNSQQENELNQVFYKILDAKGAFFTYSSNIPIHVFLNYIVENKQVLVHGSNNRGITQFEPRTQTLANGIPVKAVFASSDGIWSLFFAVVNRKSVHSLRNMCITIPTQKGIKRYYYFSIAKQNNDRYWTNGTIYILPKCTFEQGGVKSEWITNQHVTPLAKINVSPSNFPFCDQVSKHNSTESPLKTLFHVLVRNRK
ncbi:hypothetical protein NC661_11505 [Aquibacillus koreensis]|uniref:Uncharacterized protein n=1 Tax=Aquibacillus koreensis TaxID=279446 RepID=A0A9X3WMN6_9BACI|nr:hypothetical protein [Aquibacillus koreensis]MCT2535137.1 hypothetical protein [Aquibacillus koreensis]MDC3420996.1 hypothetical protein [Aquibacillus koreensis]